MRTPMLGMAFGATLLVACGGVPPQEAGRETRGAGSGGRCVIDGHFYDAGDWDPRDPCRACIPELTPVAFSERPDGAECGPGAACISGICTAGALNYCVIDGQRVPRYQTSPADPCRLCDPQRDAHAWSIAADGTVCGDDQTCQTGVCTPVSGFTVCTIDGTIYPNGAADPVDPCRVCDLDVSATDWTDAPNGTACNDAGRAGVCEAGLCQPSAGCTIDGASYPDGALNPVNPCQACIAAVSQSRFTTLGDGTACGNGGTCQDGACWSG